MNQRAYQTRLIASSWCRRPSDVHRVARSLLAKRPPHVWLLRGPLGAGKTSVARAALRALGVRGPIISPTFVLQKTYRLRRGPWTSAVHVDAYRVKRRDEQAALIPDRAVLDPRTLFLVEWPERLRGRRWGARLVVSLRHHRGGRMVTAMTHS